jgi:hypothetical protein
LLQRVIGDIVAPCSQEEPINKQRNLIMDNSYDNLQAHIQHARELRSEAMGELISAGWKKCTQFVKTLLQVPTHAFMRRA